MFTNKTLNDLNTNFDAVQSATIFITETVGIINMILTYVGGAATFIGLSASQFKVDSAVVSVVGGDFPQEYLQS